MEDIERLIDSDSICADLDLPLRKLRGAARAIDLITEDPGAIERGDLWFIRDGIHGQLAEIQRLIEDLDSRMAKPPKKLKLAS